MDYNGYKEMGHQVSNLPIECFLLTNLPKESVSDSSSKHDLESISTGRIASKSDIFDFDPNLATYSHASDTETLGELIHGQVGAVLLMLDYRG